MGEKETMAAEKASGGKKTEEERASNLNLSKSNRELADDEANDTARATNLNTSRSNRGGDPGLPAQAAVNTSHSNIKNLVSEDPGAGSDVSRAANLNASKSNRDPGGDAPGDPAAINNSKSNIKD